VKNIEDIYRLSPMQAGILFHCLAAEGSPLYFEQYLTGFDGDFDPAALHRAWVDVVARHAALRTAFVWEGLQEPLQVVVRDVALPWEGLDWTDRTDVPASAFDDLLRADRARPFVLTQAPLMRFTLVQLAGRRHALLWSLHHLLLDGWSCALVRQEVAERYRAIVSGRATGDAPPTPFVRYIEWLERQDASAAERFWRERLAGVARTPLPIGADAAQPHAAGKVATDEGAADNVAADKVAADEIVQVERTLSREATDRLQAAARAHGLTSNTLCQAAWALVLGRYAGTTDVLFGATVSGRPADLPDVERLIGLFINTVPVRVTMPPGERVAAWLQRLQRELIDAREYEYASLADVQRWSGLPHGRPPFDSLFVYENYPGGGAADDVNEAAPLRVRPMTTVTRTNYPLTLTVRPGAQLQLLLEGDAERVGADVLRRMLSHVDAALDALTGQMDAELSAVSFVPEDERQQVVRGRMPAIAAPAAAASAIVDAAAAYQAPRDALELDLVRLWETLLGAQAIGIRDTFTARGGHSILLLRLVSQIERRFGVRLPLADLVRDTTIERLTPLIRERRSGSAEEPRLVALQSDGPGLPLFAVVPAGGTLACYLPLAERLGATRPFYALQPRASFDEGGALPSIEEMARGDLQELRRVQPSGPYAIAGWSMAGLVAYEIARQLREAGEVVHLLALLDAGVPDADQPASDATEAAVLLVAEQLALDPADLGDVQGDARLDAMLSLAQARGRLAHDADLRWVRWLVHGFRIGVDAVQRYRPQPYDGSVFLIRSTDDLPAGADDDPTLGWGALARGGVDVHAVPGSHDTMVQPPHVTALAACLRARLDTDAATRPEASPEQTAAGQTAVQPV